MEMEYSCIPPGFRFRPTEEELVDYYLRRKINSLKFDLDFIIDINLHIMEPWDIQDRCRLGYGEESEWYFFSYKDKKYPTGMRTNRATATGFWKATGRDKAVLSKKRSTIIGMRKTLVFYKGRSPNGRKTDWIIHEYRLQTAELLSPPQEGGWVVCRAFKKPSPNHKQGFQAWNHANYVRDYNMFDPPSCPNPMPVVHLNQIGNMFPQSLPFGAQKEHIPNNIGSQNQLVELPQLGSPSLSPSLATNGGAHEQNGLINENYDNETSNQSGQFVDWKILDDLLAPQMPEPASLVHSSCPLISQESELNAQNQASHLCLHSLSNL